MIEIIELAIILVSVFCLTMAVITAVKDKKDGKCLWCSYKKTGNSNLHYYREDGISKSERFYEYRCNKCGTIKNFID